MEIRLDDIEDAAPFGYALSNRYLSLKIMKSFAFKNREASLLLLLQEISSSEVAIYHHRLHALLLMMNGQSCTQIAELFGEDKRTIQRWANRFEEFGLDGLNSHKRNGRESVFSARQLEEIQKRLSSYPPILEGRRRTMNWTGELLSMYLDRKYGVSLGFRQCQRLLKQLGPHRNRSVSET